MELFGHIYLARALVERGIRVEVVTGVTVREYYSSRWLRALMFTICPVAYDNKFWLLEAGAMRF